MVTVIFCPFLGGREAPEPFFLQAKIPFCGGNDSGRPRAVLLPIRFRFAPEGEKIDEFMQKWEEGRMRKKALAWFLIGLLLVGLVPSVPVLAADTESVITVEKYDENGNGTFLLLPKRVAKAGGYSDTWLKNALGAENVQIEDRSYVTGYVDAAEEDGWLNQGDIAPESKWIVSVNGTCYDDISWFYASEIKVIRVIFCPSGNGAEFSLGSGGWGTIGTMPVDKDDLIAYASGFSADDFAEGSAQAAAYQKILDTILNPKATAVDVEQAKADMEAALQVPAEGITLSAEEVNLSVGQSETVYAALTPDGTTDSVQWSTADPSVAVVDADGTVTAVAPGKTSLTAFVNGKVSQTIPVQVEKKAAENIYLKQKNVQIRVTESVMLEAEVEPADSGSKIIWSVNDGTIVNVRQDGRVIGLKEGCARVTVTAGGHSDTCEVTVTKRDDPYVYFEYSDGTVQQMENGGFTLGALDEGFFRVANTDAVPFWENEEKIDAGRDSVAFHWYVDRKTGRWQPSGFCPEKPITVTAGDFTQTFSIRYTETSGITALRTYVNGEEVSMDTPYEVTGCVTGIPVYTEGLLDGKWVEIPVQALEYGTDDSVWYNFRFVGNELFINRSGAHTMTVSLKGEPVSVSFRAICHAVEASAMEVVVPEICEIDGWDANWQHYVGVKPFSGYQVNYTPENATNRDVVWVSLTPDVAEHSDLHSAGIIPKKAGTARFVVTNASDASLVQEVEVTFVYRHPLQSVSAETDYAMKVGESRTLELAVTPADATEQRFIWSYSRDGIVNVTDKIESDESGTVSWTTHTIEALQEGYVTVTGTPIDQTAGCAPVTFTVTVGEGVPETPVPTDPIVENGLRDAGKAVQGAYADGKYAYGDEWAVFTLTRGGLKLTDTQIDSYLASVINAYSVPKAKELKPTTIARVILTVSVLGRDASDLRGTNLVELLCGSRQIENGSNEAAWALIALDSCDYAVPDGALWTREKLVQTILKFRDSESGGFGLTDTKYCDADLTAMCLQALAPYYETDDAVRKAVDSGLNYLRKQMDRDCDYGSAETISQVILALTALKLDPLDAANGFANSAARNLLTALERYRVEGKGFCHDREGTVNTMASMQVLQALIGYDRFRNGQTALYDLTDGTEELIPVPENPADIPQTGDCANPAVWKSLMCASLSAAAVIWIAERKRKQRL